MNANIFYKKLDLAIKKTVGHKLFTLMVVDKSGKYVERVYSNNKKIYPLLGTKPIPKNAWTKRVIINKKEFLGSNFNQIKIPEFSLVRRMKILNNNNKLTV